MEPFIGEIKMVGFNFAPKGYATCDGQILPIAQNSALFSLLGTTYGGDGRTTFQLPDLRGRVPLHQGQGAGLSARTIGQVGGEENHSLVVPEMPVHGHPVSGISVPCSAEDADSGSPSGTFPAVPSGGVNAYAAAASPGKSFASGGTGTAAPAGGSAPHNTMQPYLVVNFVIALQGVFPSRQ